MKRLLFAHVKNKDDDKLFSLPRYYKLSRFLMRNYKHLAGVCGF